MKARPNKGHVEKNNISIRTLVTKSLGSKVSSSIQFRHRICIYIKLIYIVILRWTISKALIYARRPNRSGPCMPHFENNDNGKKRSSSCSRPTCRVDDHPDPLKMLTMHVTFPRT